MKKLFILLLTVAMIASIISGCKKDTSDNGQTDTGTQQVENKADKNDTADATSDKSSEPTELKIMPRLSAQLDSDHLLVKALEEKTNTRLTFEVPPYKNYEERMKLMFASADNMVDLAFFPSSQPNHQLEFEEAVEDGAILPITQYVEKSENLKEYIDPNSWFSVKVGGDGEIFGVPFNTYPRIDGYYIRLDWLENVGLTLPENNEITLDELNEILKRFTLNDPDKNGKNDTYGITLSATQGILKPIFAQTFGVIGWDTHEGKYEYMSEEYCLEHDNYKQALEHSAYLWKEGFIDPNWPANESISGVERFTKGIGGMTPAFAGWIDKYEAQLLENNPDAKMGYVSLIKKTSESVFGVRSPFGSNIYYKWVVTSAAKGKEEAIVSFLDFTLSDEGYNMMLYGVEGIHHKNENGKITLTDKYEEEFSKYRGLTMPRRYNDARLFVSPELPKEKAERVNYLLKKAQSLILPSLDMGYLPAAAKEHQFIEYKKEMDVARTKIILGEMSSNEWNNVLQGWYDAGGKDYVEQMVDFIKNNTAN